MSSQVYITSHFTLNPDNYGLMLQAGRPPLTARQYASYHWYFPAKPIASKSGDEAGVGKPAFALAEDNPFKEIYRINVCFGQKELRRA